MSKGVLTRLPSVNSRDSVARVGTAGSFDCVIVRFANDHFAQDDKS
jgi:hypothetical protein